MWSRIGRAKFLATEICTPLRPELGRIHFGFTLWVCCFEVRRREADRLSEGLPPRIHFIEPDDPDNQPDPGPESETIVSEPT